MSERTLREDIIREFEFHGADVGRDYVCGGEQSADSGRRADRILALLDEQEPVGYVTPEDAKKMTPIDPLWVKRIEGVVVHGTSCVDSHKERSVAVHLRPVPSQPADVLPGHTGQEMALRMAKDTTTPEGTSPTPTQATEEIERLRDRVEELEGEDAVDRIAQAMYGEYRVGAMGDSEYKLMWHEIGEGVREGFRNRARRVLTDQEEDDGS